MSENRPDIGDLLEKYRLGRLPPIDKLVRGPILHILYDGYTRGHGIPMAIFWPEGDPHDEKAWLPLSGINDKTLHSPF